MTRVLGAVARVVTRMPVITLVSLGILTVLLGLAAGQLEVDTGVEGFAPDDGVAAALDDVEDRFATGASVQVLVDDGPGGNVITSEAIVDVLALESALVEHPAIASVLVAETLDAPAVVSFAVAFDAAAQATQAEVGQLDAATFGAIATGVLDNGGEGVTGLFSTDLTSDPPRARAGLVVVELDAAAPSADRAAAARAIEEVVAANPVADARRGVLSITAIEDGIEAALNRDLPVLLAVSLLLVLAVLAWLFRSVVDVTVGFVGLVASVIWMVGFAALLGPGVLGLTGPFNQVSVVVPVLLVGLGIDYSVHLTTRYREERRNGELPVRSARIALSTVGVALVLATIASVAGFLANAATPLAPIRDFGIFAALGIVSAFVVLGAAVPAALTLADRRGERPIGAQADGGSVAPRPPDVGRSPRWSAALVVLATRRPLVAVGGTVLLLVGGAIAAGGISTEFDERDFLPEGEPVLATLDRLDDLFTSGVAERTFIVVDGDVDDPPLLAAVATLEQRLDDLEAVDHVDGRADTTSMLELRDRLVDGGRDVRIALAGDLAAWDDPEAAAEAVELPDARELTASLDVDELDDAVEFSAQLRAELVRRLPAGRDPLRALAATSDPDELLAAARAELADGFAADRPDGLDDAGLAELVALEPQALRLDRLAAAGLPISALDEDDVLRLQRLEALEAAGDPDATDGATLAAHVRAMRAEVPDELAAVVDADGLLVAVATSAGQERADALVVAIEELAGPVVDAGGELSVVSEPLVNAEIVQELADAQLLAIAISLTAAALLLAVATWFSARSVGLGLIGIVPSVVALVLVLGLMRLVGLSFNALTATVASIAVGIGVPYGIHLTNRYREALAHGIDADAAADDALTNTGPALVGSAMTTGLAFAVLLLSNSTPIRQFGLVSTMMIVLAALACLLVQPALLVLWGRRRGVRRAVVRDPSGESGESGDRTPGSRAGRT